MVPSPLPPTLRTAGGHLPGFFPDLPVPPPPPPPPHPVAALEDTACALEAAAAADLRACQALTAVLTKQQAHAAAVAKGLREMQRASDASGAPASADAYFALWDDGLFRVDKDLVAALHASLTRLVGPLPPYVECCVGVGSSSSPPATVHAVASRVFGVTLLTVEDSVDMNVLARELARIVSCPRDRPLDQHLVQYAVARVALLRHAEPRSRQGAPLARFGSLADPKHAWAYTQTLKLIALRTHGVLLP